MPSPTKAGAEITEPQSMSMLGLVRKFKQVHDTMSNRSFCFILGAGASVTSGIKSAGAMVGEWIDTLYRETTNHTGDVPAEWATDKTLRITGFDPKDPSGSYSALYRRMYQRDPDAGYAYLEHQMSKAEPSFGYSVLGQILAETRHRVVITVNFDNLVADSVSQFSKTYPLVCGHELLAPYITDKLRRPLVLKVHRDLLLGPMSTPEELKTIDAGFREAIGRLLRNYTPVVIGYGGNDGSLMGCLEGLDEASIPGGIYWCYRDDSPPSERIRRAVARQKGHLVDIMGFDELLMMFGNELGYEVADQYVLNRAKERSERIVEQMQALQERIKKRDEDVKSLAARTTTSGSTALPNELYESIHRAVSSMFLREVTTKRWWQWVSEAASEADIAKRDAIYRKGIEHLPHSPDMLGAYALFLKNVQKDFDAAEVMFKQAIEVDPKHIANLNNYALFLTSVRKQYDEAEALYKRALDADPTYLPALGNYAEFLTDVRKDFEAAEAMYKRAIEGDRNIINLGNYASFLADVRKDLDAAEGIYKRAIAADPKDAYTLNRYANFLKDKRSEYDAAEVMFKRAVEADPRHANALNNYALLMAGVRKDFAAAEAMYQRAVAADPENANTLVNYAKLFFDTGRVAKGLTKLDEAMVNLAVGEPSRSQAKCWMCAYCVWQKGKQAEALSQLKTLLLQSEVRTGDWDFSGVIAQAMRKKHPEANWLEKLAEVISGRAAPESLSKWPAWKKAVVSGQSGAAKH